MGLATNIKVGKMFIIEDMKPKTKCRNIKYKFIVDIFYTLKQSIERN